MTLSPHELASPLWAKISEHYEARLATHRGRLEMRLDEPETIRLRGRIEEIRELLSMAKPPIDLNADAG